MQRVRVNLKPSYDVLIGEGLLAETGKRIERTLEPSSTVVMASRRVAQLHGRSLRRGFHSAKIKWIEVADGESQKNISVLERVLQQLARFHADRRSCIVAFGGGVIGDLAGFAASVYMRGVPVVQVPTTLLAQVDAAIGGKTAINLASAKNMVGTFHQPRLVIADTSVLRTLPEREFRAGIFEIIKSGAIRDPHLFALLERNAKKILAREPKALQRIIASSVKVKAKIVVADEKESGLRRMLNFGHTVGHALEAATGYRKLLHGEAVGLGMIAAAEIGVNMGVTPVDVAERLIACVLRYGPLPGLKVQTEKVIRAIESDKKTIAGKPHFVLINRLGSTVVRNDVPVRILRDAIRSVTA